MGKDNKHWFENLATKAKTEASKGNMKAVYDITKQEAHWPHRSPEKSVQIKKHI